MIFVCPGCSAQLRIADELAGSAVQCPSCRQVGEAPRFVLAKLEDRVQTESPKPPPLPVQLAPAAGWEEDDDDVTQFGRCYIRFTNDGANLELAVVNLMEQLIETEQLDARIAHEDARPPERLRPNDVVLTGEVVTCDHGSQLIRYFFTFIALFGPGSCKLEVEATAETADGEKHIHSHSRQWIGIFGGSGEGLMKVNVKAVSRAIARRAMRFVTGRTFLNIQAYNCVNWALGLGIAAFIPFAGIPCALIGIGAALPGLIVIQQRALPRGKIRGWAGLILCLLGLAAQGAVIVAVSR